MAINPLSKNHLAELEALLRRRCFSGKFIDPYSASMPTSPAVTLSPVPLASWTNTETALFLTWWAFRPDRCVFCGEAENWYPSAEHEFQCGFCAVGAGSTRTAKTVATECEKTHEYDGAPDEDDDEEEHVGMATGQADTGCLSIVEFFLDILELCQRHPSATPRDVQRYPEILRIATKMSLLFALPGIDQHSLAVIREASLYVTCMFVSSSSLPLFAVYQCCCPRRIEWCDVVYVARSLGLDVVEAANFYRSPETHLQNLMVMLRSQRPPVDPWLSYSAESRREIFASMEARVREELSPDLMAACVALELFRRFEKNDNPAAKKLELWREERLRASHFRNEHPLKESPCSSVLLIVIAEALAMSPLELLRILHHSGVFQGRTRYTLQLKHKMVGGEYPITLYQRLTPCRSSWEVVYDALHSEDRFILLNLLRILSPARICAREMPIVTRFVKSILRRHGSSTVVNFHFCLRIIDESQKMMKGTYFCSSANASEAVYCHITAKKTITYLGANRQILLQSWCTQQKRVSQIAIRIVPPVLVRAEGLATVLLLDSLYSPSRYEQWLEAACCISYRYKIRRQMLAAVAVEERRYIMRSVRLPSSRSASEAVNELFGAQVRVQDAYESFSQFLKIEKVPFLACLSDTEIVRRCCEWQVVTEAIFADTVNNVMLHTLRKRRKRPRENAENSGKISLSLDSVPVLRRALASAVAYASEIHRAFASGMRPS